MHPYASTRICTVTSIKWRTPYTIRLLIFYHVFNTLAIFRTRSVGFRFFRYVYIPYECAFFQECHLCGGYVQGQFVLTSYSVYHNSLYILADWYFYLL